MIREAARTLWYAFLILACTLLFATAFGVVLGAVALGYRLVVG